MGRIEHAALTVLAWALEAVDGLGAVFWPPLSDWANERWALVADRIDQGLHGR